MYVEHELESLRENFPFLTEPVEVFKDEFQALGVQAYLLGLSANQKGLSVFSSAADFHSFPTTRAYFELIERYAVLSSLTNSEDGSSGSWVFSKSSGVAAHTQRSLAEKSALFELMERDRVLRYWFLQIQPTLVHATRGDVPASFLKEYDFFSFSFPCLEKESGVEVVGSFAFPFEPKNPFFYGFGAADSLEQALQKSKREAFQRFGFLYGEEIPEQLPELSLSPHYQQEYYLTRQGQNAISRWIFGESEFLGHGFIEKAALSEKNIQFEDLTPLSLQQKVFVVRAHSSDALRLTFGQGHPDVRFLNGPSQLWIHPIA